MDKLSLRRLAVNIRPLGKNISTDTFDYEFKTDVPKFVDAGLGWIFFQLKGSNINNAARHLYAFITDAFDGSSEEANKAILSLPETHCSRDQLIINMYKAAEKLALAHGFTVVTTKEDRQKGIWGEELTKYLENHFGRCTEEVTWTSQEKKGKVQLRFRFASPLICIKEYDANGVAVMASAEVSQQYTGNYTGDWTVTETMTWNHLGGGERMLGEIITLLLENNAIHQARRYPQDAPDKAYTKAKAAWNRLNNTLKDKAVAYIKTLVCSVSDGHETLDISCLNRQWPELSVNVPVPCSSETAKVTIERFTDTDIIDSDGDTTPYWHLSAKDLDNIILCLESYTKSTDILRHFDQEENACFLEYADTGCSI